MFIFASMISLGFGLNTKAFNQNGTQAKKLATSISKSIPDNDIKRLEADIQKHVYELFHEKIIGEYLYDNGVSEKIKAKRVKKIIPENRCLKDKNYKIVFDYTVFSSKTGEADAELFWNLVKDVTFYYQNKHPNSVSSRTTNKYSSIVNTMKWKSVNEDLDSVATMFIFGNRYIDLNNKYVAKHINEIRQVCYLARWVENLKKKEHEQNIKTKMQELEYRKEATIKDTNTIIR